MKKNIKLIVCMLVMVFVVAGMTGCGSKSETVKKESKESVSDKDKDTDKDDEKDTDNTDKDDNKDIDEEDGELKTDVSDWEEYSYSDYSLKLSSDWEDMDYDAAELAFVHSGTAADGFAENINTMTQDISAYDMDLDSYLDLTLDQYETLGYEVVGYKYMTINGVKGYYCITSTEVESVTYYVSQWFTIVGDNAYIFTFAADDEGFSELEEEVKDIYRTIEFK